MANLSSALNYALAGLSVSSAQSALVSRNISSAGDENYTRKTAEIHTLPTGSPAVSGIRRSADRQLLDKLLLSNSESAGQQVTLDALARLSGLTGDPDSNLSIAAAISELQLALRGYEANPASSALGRTALEAARTVSHRLNASAAEVMSIRADADNAMSEASLRVNNLLSQFKVVNDAVVRGEGTANELAESLDQRDRILKLLSEEIGIRTSTRPNNDVVIYAEGGSVLFEGSARMVSFTATSTLQAGKAGNPLYIDGVTVTGEDSPMPLVSGRIAAIATLRDTVSVTYSKQLDQIAAGLIKAFSERDPGTSTHLPDVEGLFTGTGAIPEIGGSNTGLSSLIEINSLADPEKGGSVSLLRDGGFGGSPYLRNTLSQTGYQARLSELSGAIDTALGFETIDGTGGSVSIKALSFQSTSWIAGHHQAAQGSLDVANARQLRAGDALARISGVNIDQEMASLLDLEKSYQASSKVLGIVNSMMSVLLEAIG